MLKPLEPSAYWGDEQIWDTRHQQPQLDDRREGPDVARGRGARHPEPGVLPEGLRPSLGEDVPAADSHRQLAMLDPQDDEVHFIDTCFTTHHLNFARTPTTRCGLERRRHAAAVGWLNTKMFDETGDAQKSQGWTPLILDTNGNGKRDDYVEPNQPVDPTKDKRIAQVFYAVMVSPADGTIWGTLRGSPGSIVRLDPGIRTRPHSARRNLPCPDAGLRPARRRHRQQGRGLGRRSRAAISASFDRRKCKVAQRPDRDRQSLSRRLVVLPVSRARASRASATNSAEVELLRWVDQHNTFGLGKDVPVSTGNLNDGLIAFKDGKMITLKVPYPTGFYAKGLDGRIDDPNAGWKGRGLWASSGDRVPWLQEGGKGMKPMAVHIQLRPDPLAH